MLVCLDFNIILVTYHLNPFHLPYLLMALHFLKSCVTSFLVCCLHLDPRLAY
jgi:hypothetical protein